jgi:arsenate reductase
MTEEREMQVRIYHNPACGTSRTVLGIIRSAGIEPEVVEYLKTPPDEPTLRDLLARMGIPARALLRLKGTPAAELGLDDPAVGEDAIIAAMLAHPILIERPVVVTERGAALCRPAEKVQALLPGGT